MTPDSGSICLVGLKKGGGLLAEFSAQCTHHKVVDLVGNRNCL